MASKRREKQDASLSTLGSRTAGVATSVLVSKIITILVAGASFVVVSRYLGPSIYGTYVLAMSVAGVVTAIGGMGVSNSFSKLISQYRAEKKPELIGEVISSGFAVVLLVGTLLTLLSIVLSSYISGLIFDTTANGLLVAVASVSIIFSMLLAIFSYALIGLGRQGLIIWTSFGQVTTQAVLSIALSFAGFGAFGPTIGVIIGFIVGMLLCLVGMERSDSIRLAKPSWRSIRQLMEFSLPIGIYSAVTGAVVNLANLLLGGFAGSVVVGNVGIAQRLGSLVNTVNESVGASLVPLFSGVTHSSLKKQLGKLYNYSVYIMFTLFAPAAFFLALYSKQVSYLAFGTAYTTAPYFISIVAVGLLILMIADYTTSLFIGRGKVRQLMNYGIIISVLELALLLLLIPTYRGYGMTFTVSLAIPLVTLLIYSIGLSRHLGIKIHFGKLLPVLLAALVSVGITAPTLLLSATPSLFGDLGTVIISAVLLLALYPIVLGLAKGVRKNDLKVIREVSGGIPIAGRIIFYLAQYADRFTSA